MSKEQSMKKIFRQRYPGLVILFFLAFMVPPLSARAEMAGAADVIATFNTTLLECMKKADDLGYSGRYKLLEPVIKDSFALSFMAKESVGRHWKTLKEEERNVFLKTYTDWTIATYAGRFDGYSGERFEVVSESEPDRGTVTVISKLIESKKEEIGFYYRLRKIEGKWRVVDIQISGVSQLALTRAQFVNVIKEKGFDGLISMLKDKIRGFAGSKKR